MDDERPGNPMKARFLFFASILFLGLAMLFFVLGMHRNSFDSGEGGSLKAGGFAAEEPGSLEKDGKKSEEAWEKKRGVQREDIRDREWKLTFQLSLSHQVRTLGGSLADGKLLFLRKRPGRGNGFDLLKQVRLSSVTSVPRKIQDFPKSLKVSIVWKETLRPSHLLFQDVNLFAPLREGTERGGENLSFGFIHLDLGARPEIQFECPGKEIHSLGFRIFPPLFHRGKDLFAWEVSGSRFKVPQALNPGGYFSISGLKGPFKLKDQGKAFVGRSALWHVRLIPVLSMGVRLLNGMDHSPIPNWKVRILTSTGKQLLGGTPSDEAGFVRFALDPDLGEKVGWGRLAQFSAVTREEFSIPLGKRLLLQKDQAEQFLISGLGTLELIFKTQSKDIPFPRALGFHLKALTGRGAGQIHSFKRWFHFSGMKIPNLPAGKFMFHLAAVHETHFFRFPREFLIQSGKTTVIEVEILRPWVLKISFGITRKVFASQNLRLFQDPYQKLSPKVATGVAAFVKRSDPPFAKAEQPSRPLPKLMARPFSFDSQTGAYSFFLPPVASRYSLQAFNANKAGPYTLFWRDLRVKADGESKTLPLPENGKLKLVLSPPIPKGAPFHLILRRNDGLILPSALDYMFSGLQVHPLEGVVLPGIPVGNWQVGIKTGPSSFLGFVPGFRVRISPHKETIVSLDLFQEGWMPVKGLALGDQGKPLGMEYIQVYRFVKDSWPGDQILTLETDEDGRFQIPFLPPGKYMLGIFLKKEERLRYCPTVLVHPQLKGASTQHFSFPDSGQMVLVDSRGKPLQGVHCRILVGGKSYLSSITGREGRPYQSLPPLAFLLRCQIAKKKYSFPFPPISSRSKLLRVVLK